MRLHGYLWYGIKVMQTHGCFLYGLKVTMNAASRVCNNCSWALPFFWSSFVSNSSFREQYSGVRVLSRRETNCDQTNIQMWFSDSLSTNAFVNVNTPTNSTHKQIEVHVPAPRFAADMQVGLKLCNNIHYWVHNDICHTFTRSTCNAEKPEHMSPTRPVPVCGSGYTPPYV